MMLSFSCGYHASKGVEAVDATAVADALVPLDGLYLQTEAVVLLEGRCHLFERCGIQQLAAEENLLPAKHVAGGGVELTRGKGHGHIDVDGVLKPVGPRGVAGGAPLQDHAVPITAAVVHGEGREDVLLQEVAVLLAADLLQ
jgi:hypothetical protein